jgi:hypothetical protein
MKSTDPASLQNLNAIVLPAPVDWWPLANGWYVVFGVLLIAIGWIGYRSVQGWIANRYRRTALQKLQLLAENIRNEVNRDSSLRQIPILLKRTALSAYPREQVASLSGKDWFDFLNSSIRNPSFTESTFVTLDKISYSCGELGDIDTHSITALLNASKQWLKNHQAKTRPQDSGET